MIIEISTDAANDPDAHRWLDRLVTRIEDRWHVWKIDAPSELEETAWLRDQGRAGGGLRELFAATVSRSAYPFAPHTRETRVTLEPTEDGELTPQAAARLADERLVVLVENRESDGAFLRRVVADLDRTLNNYWNLDPPPLHIDSIGGKGQMGTEVQRRCREAGIRPRLVVVVDSDRRGPDQPASVEARELETLCARLGVPVWVLAKREAENFLPRPLLDARPNAGSDHARRVEAWDALSDDQKDYYDMKHGIPNGDEGPHVELFQDLPQGARQVLSDGFGPNIDACWSVWRVRSRDSLKERGLGDLEHGLELLRREV